MGFISAKRIDGEVNLIAIDLGSNTLRVVQIECESGQIIASFEKIVKTADGLAQSGLISQNALQRVIDALKEAQGRFDFASDHLRAVTTEALRRASNAAETLEEIQKQTGIIFEVIDGEEEARLTLLAVEHRLSLLSGGKSQTSSFLLIDIGGGSTELVFRYPHRTYSKSFPIGIVTVAQSYHSLDAIEEALPSLMREIEEFAALIFRQEGIVDDFVATAGTPTTVAALKIGQTYNNYDPSKINGSILDFSDLERQLGALLSLPFDERERRVGVGRSDLIAAGILIFKQLFLIAKKQECIVIDDSLREGVALEECDKRRVMRD
jgi:exopolyphosphatase/guanosine-5'-triphosphate,3'-diphosphate pyrophosphatase